VLEADHLLHDEMKDKTGKEYSRRIKNVACLKMIVGNLIQAINTREVSLV